LTTCEASVTTVATSEAGDPLKIQGEDVGKVLVELENGATVMRQFVEVALSDDDTGKDNG